ncbi:FISUMP domain-containing protein [Hallerella succinigenes]|uniref:FISUMP domain-containing protein n=1 Tax=Hallerella succinigenes TaxID=1896222 RepID=UPI001F52F421|nr:FISUMP domain-containing protein [Hallerella succinigenes]
MNYAFGGGFFTILKRFRTDVDSKAGTALKSTSGWGSLKGVSGNGTDAFGFSALPAGYRRYNGDFKYEGDYAFFWSSTEDKSLNAYCMYLGYDVDFASLDGTGDNYTGFSVRCLKD